jgi:hypothetical protein
VALDFTTPFGARPYQLETAPHLHPNQWAVVPDAVIRPTGTTTYRAEGAADAAAIRFYRLAVSP